jgi:hypothetical protein
MTKPGATLTCWRCCYTPVLLGELPPLALPREHPFSPALYECRDHDACDDRCAADGFLYTDPADPRCRLPRVDLRAF